MARREARRAERRKTAAPSTVRGHGPKPIDVIVEDLSRTGIRFASEGVFSRGDVISIGLGGVGTTVATVAWANDGRYGCSFAEPIGEDAVDRAFAARTVVQWAVTPNGDSEEARRQAMEAVQQIYGRHRSWSFPPDVYLIAALMLLAGGLFAWHYVAS